ncbi:folylpolyglutamate synthase/dihydrofolate synthase family protein [Saccharibacillus sp. JS10]|uniref:bifunctional folylpolyglutamate synthase/dihydrofolate synthase n=1 Tax=Saccharibacillus sp. JS10 TaxID=2950552 RepID=UPI00210AA165|nr:folylpolyglutamate synthase/dihydrofolate synthase family protein [Saccharibacillus sp. JS10]MCQ4088177.1 bifunctional folylpolyglutamate synthase/dihydrofolate synthase [Saccharibacillus sp. JS10]
MENNERGAIAPLTSYAEAVDWINGLIPFGIRPGLERIEALMEHFGHPHRRLKFVHVAGTNGKGSTCAFLTSVLIHNGYDVGTFTSPFITKFTNRFQYNGEDIPDETLLELSNRLRPVVKQLAATEMGSPTMFEVSTALAILYYADVCFPDVVIWETGLGGRMDVTNIVNPVLSVITNVGHDHMDILGDTLEKIATEKAGIIKPGVPVVTSVSQPEALNIIKQTAASRNSSCYAAGEKFFFQKVQTDDPMQKLHFQGPFREFDLSISLRGEYQLENAAGAFMALEVLRQYMAFQLEDDKIIEGFRSTFWAGRMELVQHTPRILIDGAHNPEGAAALAQSLSHDWQAKKIVLMMGMLSTKSHEDYLKHILPLVDELILTEPDFRKKMDAYALAEIVEGLRSIYAKDHLQITVQPDWQKALTEFKTLIGPDDLGVISGTLYLISDVRAQLLHQADSEKGW